MRTGRVVGNVVSTVKNENLTGIKLLVVQILNDGLPAEAIVAADATKQAGVGDYVFIMESKEAGLLLRRENTPADASVCGFIDSYNELM
ncbi:ethanolamine utilization protein EutN [Christensenellaceae bacterium]|nr:ethanolamine utilization protein EutN [Christensenellaceae bacterium]BDF61582.1 ethanolamine utilization protein EutN [Christensenellaceae bacterium]